MHELTLLESDTMRSRKPCPANQVAYVDMSIPKSIPKSKKPALPMALIFRVDIPGASTKPSISSPSPSASIAKEYGVLSIGNTKLRHFDERHKNRFSQVNCSNFGA